MKDIKNKLKSIVKKTYSWLKKAWRKFKYLDKTQLNYYIVTGFIGLFCMFTTTTYSLFTVSKYLNAATITIAKLSYTLSSSNTSYNAGNITVGAGETLELDLTLESLNDFNTKYALNYSSDTLVSVFYSQNYKNNMMGEIGSRGSSIEMRVVIVNNTSSVADVNFTISGGYLHNSLTSNITSGYFEQDITIRTVLYEEDFTTSSISQTFPSVTSGYMYYKTECTSGSTPNWDYDNWTLNIGGLKDRTACDVYFKKMSTDIEIYFMLQDASGNNGILSSQTPSDDYTYQRSECSNGATASWSDDDKNLTVSNISGKTLCVAYFNKST